MQNAYTNNHGRQTANDLLTQEPDENSTFVAPQIASGFHSGPRMVED